MIAELAEPGELYTGPEYQKAFSNPEDNPDLPNVLIMGDSISIGYTIEVRKLLTAKADVFRIKTNGRNSAYGLKVLNRWLEVGEWDLIHFNWGLWDLCYRDRDSGKRGSRDKVNGTLTETPEQYGKNLEQIVAQLLETKAKLIWCATTPVPAGEAGRFEGDAIKYNQVAETIMNRHEIPINDLHAHALLKLPGISKQSGDVHFTPEGYAFLAEKVAAAIQEQLSLP
ncbi:MAG: SGNH/GDSL hydrolase family protein [Verrucomicrobiota bacterium]